MARFAPSIAALAFSESKMVSMSSMSTPPSISAPACSSKASLISANSMGRDAGSLMSADIDEAMPVGPMEPATKRGRSGVEYLSASLRAICAPAVLICLTRWSVEYSFCESRVALNVLVSMMSAPASRYSRWMPAITSGEVRHRMSLLPLSGCGCSESKDPRKSFSPRPLLWIITPIEPSSSRTLRSIHLYSSCVLSVIHVHVSFYSQYTRRAISATLWAACMA